MLFRSLERRAKDFATEGFPLIGGRLEYISSRPVAALVYKYNQHIINVFEWPASASLESAQKLFSRRGYQIYTWQKESMNYWVISDLNAADLQRFVAGWL